MAREGSEWLRRGPEGLGGSGELREGPGGSGGQVFTFFHFFSENLPKPSVSARNHGFGAPNIFFLKDIRFPLLIKG